MSACDRCKTSKGIVYWNIKYPYICYRCWNVLLQQQYDAKERAKQREKFIKHG